MIWGHGSIWKVFKVVRAVFEKLGAGLVSWGGLTVQGRRSNRPGQNEQVFALSCIPMLHHCIGSGGVCFGSVGACICTGGALSILRALVWWLVLLA
jgi:hypothetical protein